MHAGNRGHDGQAQAVVVFTTGACRINPVEPVEQSGQMFTGDGLASVHHLDRHPVVADIDPDAHAAARFGMSRGVADQVRQRTLQQANVDLATGIPFDFPAQAGFVVAAPMRAELRRGRECDPRDGRGDRVGGEREVD